MTGYISLSYFDVVLASIDGQTVVQRGLRDLSRRRVVEAVVAVGGTRTRDVLPERARAVTQR